VAAGRRLPRRAPGRRVLVSRTSRRRAVPGRQARRASARARRRRGERARAGPAWRRRGGGPAAWKIRAAPWRESAPPRGRQAGGVPRPSAPSRGRPEVRRRRRERVPPGTRRPGSPEATRSSVRTWGGGGGGGGRPPHAIRDPSAVTAPWIRQVPPGSSRVKLLASGSVRVNHRQVPIRRLGTGDHVRIQAADVRPRPP
jgi:hypothetical protein